KRVDLAHVDHLKRVPKFRVLEIGRSSRHETLPQVVDVRRHRLVAQDGKLPARLCGGLPAKLDVLLGCVLIRWRCDWCLCACAGRSVPPTCTSNGIISSCKK